MDLIVISLIPAAAYDDGVLRGIARTARATGGWRFRVSPYHPRQTADLLREWKPAGVIGRVFNEVAVAAVENRIPAVNVSNNLGPVPIPRVGLDDAEIGRLAARYFLDRGFRNLGFVTAYPTGGMSIERHQGFCEVLGDAGICPYIGPVSAGSGEATSVDVPAPLLGWVRSLPRPAAVFACNDLVAQDVSEACRVAEIAVPEDIAILGVDNSELRCEVNFPPLSSIAVGGPRVGREAARLLAELMDGKLPPVSPMLFPPEGVITRQSTDVLAIDEPDLAAAVRYIREHAHEPIRVRDVLDEVPVARRVLEQQFRRILGRSPLDEIHRVRIQRARELLSTTDMPIPEVAAACGLSSRERLNVLFRKLTGHTPAAYRRQWRA